MAQWRARDALFTVSDPDCIPNDGKHFRIARGDANGMQISFPTAWLFEPFEPASLAGGRETQHGQQIPDSLVTAVRAALAPHIHRPDLTVEKAASLCGYAKRRLARELQGQGTTLSREIARLRAEHAEKELAFSDNKISSIGEQVGFTDATVFSRAFKNWTGQ